MMLVKCMGAFFKLFCLYNIEKKKHLDTVPTSGFVQTPYKLFSNEKVSKEYLDLLK